MNGFWKTILWQQFGASIDMLNNAIRACPDELWRAQVWEAPSEIPGYSQFWYVAYHALFWLDLYRFGAVEGFAPPAPFTLDELDPAGIIPEKPYPREELLAYLRYCRAKCQSTLAALIDESAQRRCRFGWGEVSFAELQLYSMRHVQEHATQLSLFLGQQGVSAPDWVPTATPSAR